MSMEDELSVALVQATVACVSVSINPVMEVTAKSANAFRQYLDTVGNHLRYLSRWHPTIVADMQDAWDKAYSALHQHNGGAIVSVGSIVNHAARAMTNHGHTLSVADTLTKVIQTIANPAQTNASNYTGARATHIIVDDCAPVLNQHVVDELTELVKQALNKEACEFYQTLSHRNLQKIAKLLGVKS